jgi:hypothetical protein
MKYNQPFGAANEDAPYVNGNPATGTPGSIPPAASIEHPQREILKVITEAGLTPSATDLTQLWQAIKAIAAQQATQVVGDGLEALNFTLSIPFASVAGTNALTGTFEPNPGNLYLGMVLLMKIANANTGAVTLNANSKGAKAVVNIDGSDLAAGAFIAGSMVLAAYDGTKFQVLLVSNPAQAIVQKPGVTGQLVMGLGNSVLPYTLRANGATFLRASYPALADYALNSGRIVSETDWQDASKRLWTAFSSGDGSTTIRLPDLRGEFMRFFDDGRGIDVSRVLGKQQADSIGPYTGTFSSNVIGGIGYQVQAGGPFAPAADAGYGLIPQPASGNISIAGTASETRPRNAAVMPCIVY